MAKLYLIPVPIYFPEEKHSDDIEKWHNTLSQQAIEKLIQLNDFIVENAKTARQILGKLNPKCEIRQINIFELNKHQDFWQNKVLQTKLQQMFQEKDEIGLISEAGCPAVADPGVEIVQFAREKKWQIIPLAGPSSIIMALMASGLGGQNFHFHGYLAKENEKKNKQIRELEINSRKGITQIFIETPYRNQAMLQDILSVCAESTMLCLAIALNSKYEQIKTLSIKQWRKNQIEEINHLPCVFVLKALNSTKKN